MTVMTGEEFEELVAGKMTNLGWQCTGTPRSNDYGADVVCQRGKQKLVIQCKCYSGSNYVGVQAINEVHAAVAHYEANRGVVVYTGRATKQALNLAESTRVLLLHVDELKPGCILDKSGATAADFPGSDTAARALKAAGYRVESPLDERRPPLPGASNPFNE